MTGKIALNSLAGCKWWDISTSQSPTVETAASLDVAMNIYEETLSEFESLMKKDSEQQWLRKVISTGTHSDQVAALVTLTQMNPVLAMPYLRQLLNLAQVKASRIVQPALAALKRLLVEDLLPSRKLKFFSEQDLLTKSGITKTHLLLFYFEDLLKKTFATFIQLLFDAQTSPIESIRTSCVDFSFDILAVTKGANATGEQEKPLLKLLVKSLGDKAEKRVSAKACLLIRKLAVKRPHLKEQLVDEVREQHLIAPKSGANSTAVDQYSRGIVLACSLFSSFPLNPQDDAFLAGKLVKIVSELVNKIIDKKQARDKKRKLDATCGLSEADARVLRLCLKALAVAFAAAGSECPLPATTNALLIRLSHETTIPGLSVAILNFLNRLSQELKTDSPKLLRAIFGQVGNVSVYLSNSLPWLLSLVRDSVLGDAYAKDPTKIAFRRRLVQVASCVSEPGVLPVILALTEPKQMEADILKQADDDEDSSADERGYNPSFWDPCSAGAEKEQIVWERHLLKFHFDETVRKAADSASVEVPEESKSLSSRLVDVSKLQLETTSKKKRKVTVEDAPIEMPGIC